jgi:PKD repeat protein
MFAGFAVAAFAAASGPVAAETVALEPIKDTTIYEEGALSNGAGDYLFAGTNDDGDERRALLAFDIAGSIPAGSTITEVALTMTVSRTRSGAQTVGLHRVISDWGEGPSNAPGNEGGGTAAMNGDATWSARIFPDQPWTQDGGDFLASPSSEAEVAGIGTYTWASSSALIDDVQRWLDTPAENVGWLVSMSTGGRTKRFNSRENPSATTRPILTVEYITADPPPVASFELEPANPVAGEPVSFIDTSTGNPDSWLWDFGDGATSIEQAPSHTFDVAGTYEVSLTASNAGGSDTTTQTIVVTDETALTSLYFIAAAAKAAGAEGSFFVTDVDIQNRSSITATYRLLWLPRGENNLDPVTSGIFTLAAGASVRYKDVLGTVFGFDDDAVGAMAVVSDSAELLLMSRTFNQGDSGTFGQSIPGEAAADLIGTGDRRRLLYFTETVDFRSNLGILNGTGAPITVRWERFRPDGTSLGVEQSVLAPWSNTQINRVFGDIEPVEGAYVDVWTETPDGFFSAYGSVLDNRTSDPTTVLPQ